MKNIEAEEIVIDSDEDYANQLIAKEKEKESVEISMSRNTFTEDDKINLLNVLKDESFFSEARPLIIKEMFTSEYQQILWNIWSDFYDKYGKLPDNAIVNREVLAKTKDKQNDTAMAIRLAIHKILDTPHFTSESKEYWLSALRKQRKKIGVLAAVGKLVEAYRKDDDTEIKKGEELIVDAINMSYSATIRNEIELFKDAKKILQKLEDDKMSVESYTTGVPAIDDCLVSGGVKAGEIASFSGATGGGKSFALQQCALENVARKKKVLYISLELSAESLTQRMFPSILDPDSLVPLTARNVLEHKEIIIEKSEQMVKDANGEDMLLVIGFPAKSMGIMEFRSYIGGLRCRGFRPDVVIVDYVGEMKTDFKMDSWQAKPLLISQLRGVAQQHKFALFTAMQTNKDGKNESNSGGVITTYNMASASAQGDALDLHVSLNQNETERANLLLRLYVDKVRDGQSGKLIHCKINQHNRRMNEITKEEYEQQIRDSKLFAETKVSHFAEPAPAGKSESDILKEFRSRHKR